MKIVNIEDGGIQPTWDVEVNPSHNYLLSNGCVSHNTISMIAGCSSGVEPLFSLMYKKHNMSAALQNVALTYVNPDVLGCLPEGTDYQRLACDDDIICLLDESQSQIFVTSRDVAYDQHISIQAAWQNYIDSGVSKTINMSNSASLANVWDAYVLAWQMRCKGITVYRDGSREKEVLVSNTNGHGPDNSNAMLGKFVRPDTLKGITHRYHTAHGNAYITVNIDSDGLPRELLSTIGKAGKCDGAYLEAICKLISMALQWNIPLQDIAYHLEEISCCPYWDQGRLIKSVPDAIGRVLREHTGIEPHYFGNELHIEMSNVQSNGNGFKNTCPECAAETTFMEGCQTCQHCGWSRCS